MPLQRKPPPPSGPHPTSLGKGSRCSQSPVGSLRTPFACFSPHRWGRLRIKPAVLMRLRSRPTSDIECIRSYVAISIDTTLNLSSRAVVACQVILTIKIATAAMSSEIFMVDDCDGHTTPIGRFDPHITHQLTSVAWRRHLLPREGGKRLAAKPQMGS